MFQLEFPPEKNWFADFRVRVDLGFLGIEKDYRCKERLIPHKKPKKRELTQEQKAENKLLARERIVVEHSIAGLKRYRIPVIKPSWEGMTGCSISRMFAIWSSLIR